MPLSFLMLYRLHTGEWTNHRDFRQCCVNQKPCLLSHFHISHIAGCHHSFQNCLTVINKKCNTFECNVGGEYTHGLRFWGTVFFWKVWRWPWSSCWGRRRCLRCSRRTSSLTAWSACVCLSLRCTMFWLCNSSAGRRQDLCIHEKSNGMLMILFWLCVLGWVALVILFWQHICVCITFPSKFSCCISWSLLPMPMKAQGWDSCSEQPSRSICSLFFFHPQPIRYTQGGGQKNLDKHKTHFQNKIWVMLDHEKLTGIMYGWMDGWNITEQIKFYFCEWMNKQANKVLLLVRTEWMNERMFKQANKQIKCCFWAGKNEWIF